jgi:hypothetical protein
VTRAASPIFKLVAMAAIYKIYPSTACYGFSPLPIIIPHVPGELEKVESAIAVEDTDRLSNYLCTNLNLVAP